MGAHQQEEDLPVDDYDESGSVSKTEFVLERHLEEFIVSNFETINFEQRLVLFDDGKGTPPNQYPTSIGRIDILAKDEGTGDFVVIELKKGRPADTVVGQTLRYIGWVKQNLCEQGQDAQGLIICSDQDAKLAYALEATMNLRARFYSVKFELNKTPPD
ncbi:hypothetical protein BH23CHL2_BH23CHL2_34790 [soil metagenome]